MYFLSHCQRGGLVRVPLFVHDCMIARLHDCIFLQLEFGSPVLPCIPEAQLINYLDNISAKADIFSTTGNMEKAFALGTNVVKG